MSRKKSITISRKPRAQSQPIATGALEALESVPESARNELVVTMTANLTEALAEKPGSAKTCVSFGFFGKALYGATYGISFGVVFGALLIGKLLPGKNIIGQAMTDATDSARLTFMRLGKRQEKPKGNDRAASKKRRASTGMPQEGGLTA